MAPVFLLRLPLLPTPCTMPRSLARRAFEPALLYAFRRPITLPRPIRRVFRIAEHRPKTMSRMAPIDKGNPINRPSLFGDDVRGGAGMCLIGLLPNWTVGPG